jgi:Predicted oxidoreductases (related to aryl-alcohol dehydrogenases)
MKKILLGKSDLEVSVLGLGAINFGTTTSEELSFQLMKEYLANGGNFIDTANNYAVWNGGDGNESERILGKWLQKNGHRSDLVIATKAGALTKNAGTGDFSGMEGLSRSVIIHSVKNSLHNLQTDYIDLFYLHVDDFLTPQEETLEALNDLIKEGLIKEIGCSNFTAWRIEHARSICQKNDYKFFCAVQQRYSYLCPTVDADFYPQLATNRDLENYLEFYKDLTMVAYSPLLNGQYNQKEIIDYRYDTYSNKAKLEKLLLEQSDPNTWVLNYIMEQFGGSVSLLTTSSIEHLSCTMQSELWK